MDNDLYAPPTQQELDDTKLYAAPTKEELESTKLHEKTAFEKLGSWAGHKVGGVVDWAGDTIKSGVNKGDDLLDMYTKGVTLGKAPQIGAYLQSKALPAIGASKIAETIGIGEDVTGLTEEEANRALAKISPGEIKLAKKLAAKRGIDFTDEQAIDFVKKYGNKATIVRPKIGGGVESTLASEDANKAYERALAEEKQRYEQTAERSGMLGAGAELAGNLLATELVAVPIAGVVGKALPSSIKYLKPTESILEVAKNQGKVKAAGAALARMGARSGVDALSGATLGAIEHGTPEGAISGGVTGAAFGALTPIAGEVLGATGSTIAGKAKNVLEKYASQENPTAFSRWLAQDILYGLENKIPMASEVQKGVTSTGVPSNIKYHVDMIRQTAKDWYSKFKQPLEVITSDMDRALENATNIKQIINIEEGIAKYGKNLTEIPGLTVGQYKNLNNLAETSQNIIKQFLPQRAGGSLMGTTSKMGEKELKKILKDNNITKKAQEAIENIIYNTDNARAYHTNLIKLNEVIGELKIKGENISVLSQIEKQLQEGLVNSIPEFGIHSDRYHNYLSNTFEPILDSLGDGRYYNQIPLNGRDKYMTDMFEKLLVGRSKPGQLKPQSATRRLFNQAEETSKLGEGSLYKLHESEKSGALERLELANAKQIDSIRKQEKQKLEKAIQTLKESNPNKDNSKKIAQLVQASKKAEKTEIKKLLGDRVPKKIAMPFQAEIMPENPKKTMTEAQFNTYVQRLSDKLGLTSDEINRMILKTNSADSILLGKKTALMDMFTGGSSGNAKSWLLQKGETTGRYTKKAQDLFNKISNLPDTQLNKIADSYISGNAALSKIPGAKALASALKTSIETGNSQLKNQVLYALVHKYGDFINEPEIPQQ